MSTVTHYPESLLVAFYQIMRLAKQSRNGKPIPPVKLVSAADPVLGGIIHDYAESLNEDDGEQYSEFSITLSELAGAWTGPEEKLKHPSDEQLSIAAEKLETFFEE